MLGKRCTFIVISPRDGQIREYGFFPRILWLGLLGGLGFVGGLGYYAYAQGFHQPGDQNALLALQDENKTLLHSLEQTREEVQQLGEAMDLLKATEDRLRAHHELEPLELEPLAADQEPGGGVGGVEGWSEEVTSLPPQKQKMMREMSVRIDHLKRMVNLQAESFEEIERKFEETNVQYLPTISPVQGGKDVEVVVFWAAHRSLYRASGLPLWSRFCRPQRYAHLRDSRWLCKLRRGG